MVYVVPSNLLETVQHERDYPKLLFYSISQNKVYLISLFAENTITGIKYLDMLENSNPHLETDSDKFIYQQDGAPPHWNLHVKEFLNARLPQRWIGHTVPNDSA